MSSQALLTTDSISVVGHILFISAYPHISYMIVNLNCLQRVPFAGIELPLHVIWHLNLRAEQSAKPNHFPLGLLQCHTKSKWIERSAFWVPEDL